MIPNVQVIPLLASLHTTSPGTASGVYWTAPVRADGNGKDSRQPIACGQIHHRRGSRNGDPTTMMPISQILNDNVRLLRTKATRPAIYSNTNTNNTNNNATQLVSHISYGEVSLNCIVNAQRHNVALWALDLKPNNKTNKKQNVSSL